MTDETNPTPGQPTPPAQPEQGSPPQQPAAAVPPAPPAPPSAGYGQAAPTGSELPAPAKKRGPGMRIVRIVASVVVVLLIGIGWKAWQNHHETASAPEKGACVQAKDTTTSTRA